MAEEQRADLHCALTSQSLFCSSISIFTCACFFSCSFSHSRVESSFNKAQQRLNSILAFLGYVFSICTTKTSNSTLWRFKAFGVRTERQSLGFLIARQGSKRVTFRLSEWEFTFPLFTQDGDSVEWVPVVSLEIPKITAGLLLLLLILLLLRLITTCPSTHRYDRIIASEDRHKMHNKSEISMLTSISRPIDSHSSDVVSNLCVTLHELRQIPEALAAEEIFPN